mgnify:CR=1 FL=1
MTMNSEELEDRAELLELRSKMRKITESTVGQLAILIQENFDFQVKRQPDVNWYAKWSKEKEDGYHNWRAKKHSEVLEIAMEVAEAIDVEEMETQTRAWGVGDTLKDHAESVKKILEDLPKTS